jgi:transposase InsO family protein
VLHTAGQQHHRGRQKVPTAKRQATSHKADSANQLWSWDISWLPGPAKGQWFYLYLMEDLFSRKIVGQEVYESESGELASDFVEKACWREHITTQDKPLVLHSDNGSPMKAAVFLQKLYDLGIVPSRSRPRVSNDNAFSEALFRTLKYRPGFPAKGFASLDEARQWVLHFVDWYNHEHRHSALNYVTPGQRHRGEEKVILERREKILHEAKKARPERWSGDIRDFSLPETVTLNPERAMNC